MKYKVKNTKTDVLVFILYHLIAVVGSITLFFYLESGGLPSLENFASFTSEKTHLSVPDVKKSSSIIKDVKGSVTITDVGGAPRPANAGEEIAAGAVVETADKSTVLIKFGGSYHCEMRLGANSKINIDTLAKSAPGAIQESTMINLIKGGIYTLLVGDTKEVDVRVKTFAAVFAVRGTKFTVLTDGTNRSLLSVHEGKVQTENFITGKVTSVVGGSNYVVDNLGKEAVSYEAETLRKLNWEDSSEAPESDMTSIVGLHVETSQAKPTEDTKTQIDPVQLVESEFTIFREVNGDIQENVALLKDQQQQYIKNWEQESPKIASDINCIQKSNFQCDLFSEKILLKRGFPRTHGSPRLKQSLVEELKKYMVEREAEIDELREKINNFETLLDKRVLVLKEAEEVWKNNPNPDAILPKLQDKTLRY